MSENKLKLRHFSLRDLLYNDKILVAISLICAVVVWISVSMNVSPDSEKTISSVSVKIETSNSTLSQLGLQIFNTSEITVNVSVSGKKYAIRDITADDIIATAITTNVNAAGKHTLPIKVEKVDGAGDFNIINDSWYPATVDVYFDTLSEQSMNIQTQVSGEDKIASGYIMGSPVLSTDIVSVSGPTTDFKKVEKIVAQATLPQGISDSLTVTPQLVAIDKSGNEVNNITISAGKNAVSMTIPILKTASLPVGVNLLNGPIGISEEALNLKFSPESLEFAAAESYLSGLSKIKVGDLDFSKLKVGKNSFTYKLADVSGIEVLDGNTTVTVDLDMSAYKTNKFIVDTSTIQITHAPNEYTVKTGDTTIQNVTVMGPKDSVKAVTASDISAVIDLTDFNVKLATSECTVKFTVKNHDDCWIVGTYKINVTVTPK